MLNTSHTNTDSAHIQHTFSTSINNIGTLNNADYADTFNTHHTAQTTYMLKIA